MIHFVPLSVNFREMNLSSRIRFQYLLIFILFSIILYHHHSDRTCDARDNERKYFSVALSVSRLANNMFEMCALYGLSKYLNRRPIIYVKNNAYKGIVRRMTNILPRLMENFDFRKEENLTNVPQIDFNMKCCTFDDPERLKGYEDDYIYLKGTFFQSFKYFEAYRYEIRNFLANGSDFSKLPSSDPNNFILCIHSRRTDFIDGRHHASNKEFIISARDYIKARENKPNVKTVIMGDDYNFEMGIFKNMTDVFVSSDSPSNDLIYSRHHCDVVLMTAPSSTFGWWIAYLSKGERVYYLDIRTTKDTIYISGQLNPDDFYDPRWSALKFDEKTKLVSLSL